MNVEWIFCLLRTSILVRTAGTRMTQRALGSGFATIREYRVEQKSRHCLTSPLRVSQRAPTVSGCAQARRAGSPSSTPSAMKIMRFSPMLFAAEEVPQSGDP